MFWLLTQYLGFAGANHILIEGKSLTAQEALDLRLVNRVVSAADLESQAEEIARHSATKPAKALASLICATRHLDADFLGARRFRFQSLKIVQESLHRGVVHGCAMLPNNVLPEPVTRIVLVEFQIT
jgi:enoyl-CoA hydratase/carnithine racemase